MSKIKDDIAFRFGVVYTIFSIAALAIVIKILFLQYVQKEKWTKAQEQSRKNVELKATRGDICAADGRPLSSSVPYYSVFMDPCSEGLPDSVFYNHIDSLGARLSRKFFERDKNPASYYIGKITKAKKAGKRYVPIVRNIDYQQLKEIKTYPIFNRGQFRGGFVTERESERKMPFDVLARRTIGLVGNSGDGLHKKDKADVGTVGLEEAFEKELSGRDGVRFMQRLSGGVWMPLSNSNVVDPQDGYDVISTIDINMQDAVHHALLEQLEHNKAQMGTAVVMEVKTGAVRAIANLDKKQDGSYFESYNIAIGKCSDPGSTFKLASMIVALEDNVVSLEDTINTLNGVKDFYGHPMRDTKRGGHGKITVQHCFEVSSNIGIASIIESNYTNNPERFVDRLYSLHLHEPLGIKLKGEGKPFIRYPGTNGFSKLSLAQMSIGYELTMTPLQTLALYNAVANNGTMVRPLFVEALRDHSKVVKKFEPEVIMPSICSDETLRKVRLMLEGVVERGTAQNIRSKLYKIAGKTGTAQMADDQGYGGQSGEIIYQSSFVGYFPADEPKYSCVVVIYAPSKQSYYGSQVAAPVFRKIADRIYAQSSKFYEKVEPSDLLIAKQAPYSKNGLKRDLDIVMNDLGIPNEFNGQQTSDWVITQQQKGFVQLSNRIVGFKTVPEVLGMGCKDAHYLLEKAGLQVQLIGHGAVHEQSLPKGSPFKQGDPIVLYLGGKKADAELVQ